jgi:hypothetical protein
MGPITQWLSLQVQVRLPCLPGEGKQYRKRPKRSHLTLRYNSSYFVDFVYLMIVRLLVSHSFVKLWPLFLRAKLR